MQNLKNNNPIDFNGIDWSPNKIGGAQFNINDFVYEANSLKILPSSLSKIIPLIVMIVFGSILFIFSYVNSKKIDPYLLAFIGCFELFFIIFYIKLFIKLELNTETGNITKGFNLNKAKTIYKISNVVFIQVIEQHIPQKKNNYNSYEINLVFKNKERLTITDHADFEALRAEALKLKEFLKVPIYTKSKSSKEIIELT